MSFVRITHYKSAQGSWCLVRSWDITSAQPKSGAPWVLSSQVQPEKPSPLPDITHNWFQVDFFSGLHSSRPIASVGGSSCYIQSQEKRIDPHLLPWQNAQLVSLAQFGFENLPASPQINIWLKIPSALLDLHKRNERPVDNSISGDGACGWLAFGLHVFSQGSGSGWQLGIPYITRLGLALGGQTWTIPWTRQLQWFISDRERPVLVDDMAARITDPRRSPAYPGRTPDVGIGIPRRASTTIESTCERILGLRSINRHDGALEARWVSDPVTQILRLTLKRRFVTGVASVSAFFRGPQREICLEQDLLQLPPPDFSKPSHLTVAGPGELPVVATLRLSNDPINSVAGELFDRGWQELLAPEQNNATEGLNFLFNIQWHSELGPLLAAFPPMDVLLRDDARVELALLARPPFSDWKADQTVTLSFDKIGYTCRAQIAKAKGQADRDGTWLINLAVKIIPGEVPDGTPTEHLASALGDLDVWLVAPGVEREFTAEFKLSPTGARAADYFHPLRIDEFTLSGLQLDARHVAVGGASPAGNATSLSSEIVRAAPGTATLNAKRLRQRLIAGENSAVVVPLRAAKEQSAKTQEYILTVDERVDRHRSRHLDIRLAARHTLPPVKSRLRVLYLNQAPFFVGLVELPDLLNFDRTEGNEIAYWSTSGLYRGWQLRAAADAFQLWLPPQGFGEEMEKGKFSEGYDDINDKEFAALCFTPPARLVLDADDETRRYGTAPWNLQTLLDGPRVGGAPGLTLKSADFEMLYGLRFRIEKASWLRIAETSARLGSPRRPLRGVDAPYADLAKKDGRLREKDALALEKASAHWSSHLETYARRLAVYELYDPRHIDFRDVEELSKSPTDPSIDPRKNARVDLRLEGRGKNGPVKAAIRKDALRNLRTSFPWVPPVVTPPPPAAGFAGSFAWAFESQRLFEALYRDHLEKDADGKEILTRDVDAVEAVVARLSFSAIGGWGQQKASFDNGKAIIAATVEAGRVSELRVERIGRIGVFCNPARLVTIFRRTVVPTEQFFLQQDDHLGRAILRKVEEYVEFTPPHRAFAQDGAQAPACLVGSSCQEKIPVDSRWGENVDVDNKPLGWRVPLHRVGALESVYGKANVSLHFRADPQVPQKEAVHRIENYERLWFYTHTVKDSDADTDQWPLIADVDYPLKLKRLPAEQEPEEGGITRAIPAGYEAFTFRLGPAHTPTNLVGHLDSSPAAAAICSSLKYVTVCRPPEDLFFIETKDIEATTGTVDGCSGEFDNILNVIDEVASVGPVPQADQQVFTDFLNNITKSRLNGKGMPAKKLCEKLEEAKKGLLEEALKAVGANVDWVFKQAERELLGICDRVATQVSGIVSEGETNISKLLTAFDRLWGEYLSVVPGTVEHARARLSIATRWWDKRGDFEDFLRQWTTAKPLEPLKKEIEDALALPVKSAKQELARVAQKIAAVESSFNEKAATFEAAWARLVHLPWLRATQVKLDPQMVTRAANALQQRLHLLCDQVRRLNEIEDSKWAADTVRAKWNTIWAGASRELSNAATYLQVRWQEFSVNAEDFAKAVGAVLKSLDDAIAEVPPLLDSTRLALRKQISEPVAEIQARLKKAVETQTANLGTEIESFRAKSKAKIVAGISAQSGTLWKAADALCTKLTAFLDGFGAEIKNFIGQHAGDAAAVSAWIRRQRETFTTLLNAAPRRVLADLQAGLDGKFTYFPSNNRALRLPRALGIVPKVPMMDFSGMAAIKDAELLANRIRSVGFRFPDFKRVDMTPVTSLLDRAKDAAGKPVESLKLKAAALQMKVNQLTDRLEADLESLKKTALKRLLPDFGGIKLEKLAAAAGIDAKLANEIKKRVKLKHGFDRQTLTGFVDASIDDLPLGQPLTLFSIGPLAVRVIAPTLRSNIRIERGSDGRVQRKEYARFKGDWAFVVGGRDMVTFIDTSLTCENGELKIDLDPKRMKLDGALQGIIEGAKKYSAVQGEDEPFSYGVKVEIPEITAFCRLDLVFPPVQAGTFAIAGLSLGALLALTLRIDPLQPSASEFKIAAGFNLASEELPFSLIVFILGGCGWFSFKIVYTVPFSRDRSPRLTINFSVAIGVAASLGLNLGFAQGFVLIAFAIRASCTEKHSSFSAVLTFAGRLRIIGMFDVSLVIVLSISYESGGGLVGQGRICVKFKICWCVTIKVERSFTYRFGKAKQQGEKHSALHGTLPALAAATGDSIPASVFWNQPTRERVPVRLPREIKLPQRNYVV
jgi:hypothetical protein